VGPAVPGLYVRRPLAGSRYITLVLDVTLAEYSTPVRKTFPDTSRPPSVPEIVDVERLEALRFPPTTKSVALTLLVAPFT
jgi:hypothetical protein